MEYISTKALLTELKAHASSTGLTYIELGSLVGVTKGCMYKWLVSGVKTIHSVNHDKLDAYLKEYRPNPIPKATNPATEPSMELIKECNGRMEWETRCQSCLSIKKKVVRMHHHRGLKIDNHRICKKCLKQALGLLK